MPVTGSFRHKNESFFSNRSHSLPAKREIIVFCRIIIFIKRKFQNHDE